MISIKGHKEAIMESLQIDQKRQNKVATVVSTGHGSLPKFCFLFLFFLVFSGFICFFLSF
jgi:hypothetical protein